MIIYSSITVGPIRCKQDARWMNLFQIKNDSYCLLKKFSQCKTQQAIIRDQWHHLELMEPYSFAALGLKVIEGLRLKGDIALSMSNSLSKNISHCLDSKTKKSKMLKKKFLKKKLDRKLRFVGRHLGHFGTYFRRQKIGQNSNW